MTPSIDAGSDPLPGSSASSNGFLTAWLRETGLGDNGAFEALYLATSRRLFRVALRVVGRPAIAEDVLQEAFISVWQNAATYRSELSAPMTWLTQIVRNRAIDAARGTDRLLVPLFDDSEEVAIENLEPDHVLSQKQIVALFEQHLLSLQGGPRQAIYLSIYRGMSHTEIAASLDTPLGTVKTWIRRGTTACPREPATPPRSPRD